MITPEKARWIANQVEQTGWEIDFETAQALRDLASQVEELQAGKEALECQLALYREKI